MRVLFDYSELKLSMGRKAKAIRQREDSGGQAHRGSPANSYGLRTVLGSDPAGATDCFSLDQLGNQTSGDFMKVYSGSSTYKDNFAAGTAFVVIRRSDSKGPQLSKPGDHTMVATVQQGLRGWVWTLLGVRLYGPGSNLADHRLLKVTSGGELILAGGTGSGYRFAELVGASNPSGWSGVIKVKNSAGATAWYFLLYHSP